LKPHIAPRQNCEFPVFKLSKNNQKLSFNLNKHELVHVWWASKNR